MCDATPSSSRDEASVTMDKSVERSEADKLVDRMSFEKLCDEFEGVSNPSVEATVRQLVRDILAMREGNRALGTFAISVKYKVCQTQKTFLRLQLVSTTKSFLRL